MEDQRLDQFYLKVYRITDSIDNILKNNMTYPLEIKGFGTFIRIDDEWTNSNKAYTLDQFRDILVEGQENIHTYTLPSDLTYVFDTSDKIDWNRVIPAVENYIVYKITDSCRSIYKLINDKEIYDIQVNCIEIDDTYLGEKLRDNLFSLVKNRNVGVVTTKNPHEGYCITMKDLPTFCTKTLDKAKEVCMSILLEYKEKQENAYILESGKNFKLIQTNKFLYLFTLDKELLNLEITPVCDIKQTDEVTNDKIQDIIKYLDEIDI